MTKKQKKVLWRIIATAVLVAVVKLFSIGGVAGTVLYLAAYLIIGYDIPVSYTHSPSPRD